MANVLVNTLLRTLPLVEPNNDLVWTLFQHLFVTHLPCTSRTAVPNLFGLISHLTLIYLSIPPPPPPPRIPHASRRHKITVFIPFDSTSFHPSLYDASLGDDYDVCLSVTKRQ